MPTKYFVAFTLPEPHASALRVLMDDVAAITGLTPPHENLPPHVTFHRPIEGIREITLRRLVMSAVLQMEPTRITVDHLSRFGGRYFVLSVHATYAVAGLWVGLGGLLAILPEYGHDAYDRDNTLHITIAETTSVLDYAWPAVSTMHIKPITVPVESLSLYRKPEGGRWELVETFPFPGT